MAVGKPLTPAQVAKAWATFLDTGNYSEAARTIGVSESAVRRTIQKRQKDGTIRAELHAQAMLESEFAYRELMAKARAKAETGLAKATEPDAIRAMAAVIHEGAKTNSTLRVNHAKLNGTLVERREMSGSVALEGLPDRDLDRRIAELEEAARRGQ